MMRILNSKAVNECLMLSHGRTELGGEHADVNLLVDTAIGLKDEVSGILHELVRKSVEEEVILKHGPANIDKSKGKGRGEQRSSSVAIHEVLCYRGNGSTTASLGSCELSFLPAFLELCLGHIEVEVHIQALQKLLRGHSRHQCVGRC